MDFRSVTGLTIPAGSVNSIKIGNISVWSKSTENKYKILKNDEQVAKVTMSNFVKAVQSGDAQTDWGIGAQVVIPYTDPFDNNEYELPFNFGTFEAYGDGKLGLQAHYGVPSQNVPYSNAISGANLANAALSYMSCWVGAVNTSRLTGTVYAGKATFPNCLPADFRGATLQQTFSYRTLYSGSISTYSAKFFLPTVQQMNINPNNHEGNNTFTSSQVGNTNPNWTKTLKSGTYSGVVNIVSYVKWEYWGSKFSTLTYGSTNNSSNLNLRTKFIEDHNNYCNAATRSIFRKSTSATTSSESDYASAFPGIFYISSVGKVSYFNLVSNVYRCTPCCVIG